MKTEAQRDRGTDHIHTVISGCKVCLIPEWLFQGLTMLTLRETRFPHYREKLGTLQTQVFKALDRGA